MSYKYKEQFKRRTHGRVVEGTAQDERDELDEVYDLAELSTQHLHNLSIAEAKADEYEAKAKAFDAIKTIVESRVNDEESNKAARSNDYEAGMLRAYEVMKYNIEDFYKGGESK